MKRPVSIASLLCLTSLAFATLPAHAEVISVNSVLTAQKAGAPAAGIIAMVNDPANTVGMSAGDLVTLRDAGVPENVIAAAWARMPTPTVESVPLMPDDLRLIDLVKLVKSGISQAIVAEQVKNDPRPYRLTVNDLLYLKYGGVGESTIAAMMATRAVVPGIADSGDAIAAPASLTFDDLIMKTSFMKKNRPGRLVMQGDTLAWTDGNDPKQNFEIKTAGLENVWFTCQERSPDSFCYQINFQIVKGARYRFQDMNRESGSNAAVLKVMEAMRAHFPQLAYGPPES
jgi:hypothetical protein